MRTRSFPRLFFISAALLLALSACGDDDTSTVSDQPDDAPTAQTDTGNGSADDTEASTQGETDAPTDGGAPAPVTEGPADALEPVSAEPQRVEFETDDGVMLVGHYFPGATNPAPLVVLMHWAGGDQRDWFAIAPWLQNRSDELAAFAGWEAEIGPECEDQQQGPWLDPSWFPMMPANISFGVFVFDDREFCESGGSMTDPSEWALDSKAAIDAAAMLEGVDPGRMAAIGASIGADGAPDGCLLHNLDSSTCLGAFSLSPGDYLIGTHYDQTYAETVATLDSADPPIPVWCLAAEDDFGSPDTCRSASGTAYVMQLYPGDAHGMWLLVPELEPNPMVLIQDFLEASFGLSIN